MHKFLHVLCLILSLPTALTYLSPTVTRSFKLFSTTQSTARWTTRCDHGRHTLQRPTATHLYADNNEDFFNNEMYTDSAWSCIQGLPKSADKVNQTTHLRFIASLHHRIASVLLTPKTNHSSEPRAWTLRCCWTPS